MPTRLSKVLGVSRKILEGKGVYNCTVDFDSKLHIDPALLNKCTIPELLKANKKVEEYFNNILMLLKNSKKENDALWRTALKKLTFGEGLNTGLGYSEKGVKGSGIGPEIAERITKTVKEIVDAGVIDPAIFDLVPLFETGIGPDRISDMISIILTDELIAYTKRVCIELNVKPYTDGTGNIFVFIPKSILSDLPIAEQWEDVQVAAAYNAAVREALSKLIGKSWKKIAEEYTKQDLRDLLIKNPELLKELLRKYKARPGNGYDFVIDHLGVLLWDKIGQQAAMDSQIDLSKYGAVNDENIHGLVIEICKQFKKLIEHNGLAEHIYDSNGDRRPERFAQLLFFAVADSYCTANNLDLNREINGGSGALDFKVSRGLKKVTLEMKYSSNRKLVEGYEKQLPAYNRAEGVPDNESIYLILRVNKNQDHKIRTIKSIGEERNKKNLLSPTFFTLDGIIKPSASKR